MNLMTFCVAHVCSYTRLRTFRTKALGEAVERTVRFDIATIVRDELGELDIEERPAAPNDHFTEVALDELHHLHCQPCADELGAQITRRSVPGTRLKMTLILHGYGGWSSRSMTSRSAKLIAIFPGFSDFQRRRGNHRGKLLACHPTGSISPPLSTLSTYPVMASSNRRRRCSGPALGGHRCQSAPASRSLARR
jgi:hypothetical protein